MLNLELLICLFWDNVLHSTFNNEQQIEHYNQVYNKLAEYGANINLIVEKSIWDENEIIRDAMQEINGVIVSHYFIKYISNEKDLIAIKPLLFDKSLNFGLVDDNGNSVLHYLFARLNERERHINQEKIIELFPSLRKFELDEVFRSAYEIYRFAIQFVPNSKRANDSILLERLKRKNSGADKPFVWLENDLNSVYASIKDIIDAAKATQLSAMEKISIKNFEKIYEIIEKMSKDGSEDFKRECLNKIFELGKLELEYEKQKNDTVKNMNNQNNSLWKKIAIGVGVIVVGAIGAVAASKFDKK